MGTTNYICRAAGIDACLFIQSETVANEGSALRGGASRSKSCPQKHEETEEERNEIVGSGGVGKCFMLE